ncbi:hypothetical protein IED13_01130 [Bosea sp. SSUT16]|uniref:Uncharacterized protein n=1 Tax=Bosea spartocytisi TaxID=2773451 RepID=A0A927E548_9HYPH|nr:hypothetical protein [Bosea spartocytisi]MBD3844282.1 hypothetical protein [Bosea spartocytisi]MCT4470612.1 hypothetical protein [Bosea spartocytisi]
MKLDPNERDFLQRVSIGWRLKPADREEDKIRQRMRRFGLVEVLMKPRRWSLTESGRLALHEARAGERDDG